MLDGDELMSRKCGKMGRKCGNTTKDEGLVRLLRLCKPGPLKTRPNSLLSLADFGPFSGAGGSGAESRV